MNKHPALLAAILACACLLSGAALAAPAPTDSVYLEELTSPELQARIDGGVKTVLIPIGGTEQSGPHIVLGKHNVRVRVLAGLIAQRLGNAVVAPVLAYVPEGNIHPPAAHMRFAGTISIPEGTFEALLEATTRSFKQHGFRDVVFLGDHGDYQKSEERVASRLNTEWAHDNTCRAHALTQYYRVAQTDYVDALKARGFAPAEIGSHAGLADTALSMAVDKSLVRTDMLSRAMSADGHKGVTGDPRRATADLGQIGVQRIVESSVAAIRAAVQAR
jgi:creatinine amidohydrolase